MWCTHVQCYCLCQSLPPPNQTSNTGFSYSDKLIQFTHSCHHTHSLHTNITNYYRFLSLINNIASILWLRYIQNINIINYIYCDFTWTAKPETQPKFLLLLVTHCHGKVMNVHIVKETILQWYDDLEEQIQLKSGWSCSCRGNSDHEWLFQIQMTEGSSSGMVSKVMRRADSNVSKQSQSVISDDGSCSVGCFSVPGKHCMVGTNDDCCAETVCCWWDIANIVHILLLYYACQSNCEVLLKSNTDQEESPPKKTLLRD